jgi:hypothetical protein
VTAAVTNAGPDTLPVPGGWRVVREDGTSRTVFRRPSGEGWAVFDGQSTDQQRTPYLGFAGSWRQQPEQAIDWARHASLQ